MFNISLGEIVISLFISIIICLLFLPFWLLAVWQDKNLHRRNPAALGFKWGYFTGFRILFLEIVLVFLIAEIARRSRLIQNNAHIEGYILVEIILVVLFALCGIFILRRHRWAWIVYTVCTLNPFFWIINGIYIKNRWEEMKSNSRPSSESHSLHTGLFTTVPQVRIDQTVNVRLETVQDKRGTPSRQDLTTETTKTYDLHTLQARLLIKLQSNVVKDIVQSNTYEGAIGFLEKRVENKTRNAHADLAHLLIHLKRHNEAIKICKEGLEAASNKSVLFQLIGIAYTMVGLPTPATNAFSNALDIDPDNPEVKDLMKALALIYPQGKANITTVAECREYLRRNPGDQSAHRRLADAYLANKNFEEATHAYEMALQIEPTDGLSHLGLGILHMFLNRYGDAIVCLTNANRHAPTNPDIYYYLGLCYLKDGQRAMALKQYEVLIRMNENRATKLFDAIYPSG